jgi:subtilisin family serine protease
MVLQLLSRITSLVLLALGMLFTPNAVVAQESETVIVALSYPLSGEASEARSERSRAIALEVTTIIGVPADRVEILPALPYLFVDAPAGFDLSGLRSIDGVRGVYRDQINVAFLDQSLAVIGQADALRNGATGEGRAVAVLDSGADYHVTDLGACTAPGPGCRVVEAFDAAPNDGQLDDATRHGTNVASVVARTAPKASIIAIDVFDGAGAPDSAVIRGLDWVYRNRARYGIVAINLSLGLRTNHAEMCPDIVYDSAFRLLSGAGVAIAAAAGNDAVRDGLSPPSCHPLAFAVGATTDSAIPATQYGPCLDPWLPVDRPPCFSNSARSLAMRAPGVLITAGGVTQGGTSQAAPHVAGAVAALMSTDAQLTAQTALQRLLNTGVPVADPRTGLVKPRLSLGAAANRAPVAIHDVGRITEGGGGLFHVLANDVDEDVAALTLTGVLAPDGCWAHAVRGRVYAGCEQANTVARLFRYSIQDSYGETAAGELRITVLASQGIPERMVAPVNVMTAASIQSDQGPHLGWIEAGVADRVMTEWLNADGSTMNNRYQVSQGRRDIVPNHLSLSSREHRLAFAWSEARNAKSVIVGAHFDGPILGMPYDASFDYARDTDRPIATVLGSVVAIGWQDAYNPTRLYAATFDNNSVPGPVSDVQVLTRYLDPSDVRTVAINDREYLLVRLGVGLSAYRFDAAGADRWNGARQIRQSEPISDFDVTALSNGTFAVVWSETEWLRESGIWYSILSAGGVTLQPPTRVTDGIGNRGQVAVAAQANGGFRVAWDVWEQGFTAILSTTVVPGTPPGTIEVDYYSSDTARDRPRDLDILVLANGNRHMLWANLSGQLRAKVRSPLPL